MKKICFILMLIFAINSFAQEKTWYQHGELYKYTMKEWKKSRLLEKLSFSANFITNFCPKITKDIKKTGDNSLELLKLYSTNLSICIDESYSKNTQNFDIIKIAENCKINMNWN